MKVADIIEQNIISDCVSLGLELEYVELIKEGKDNILRVAIDKIGDKISINDCEQLSRQIDEKIESLVKIEDGYILEVTSAGIERQLKNIRLYTKYIGKKIKLKLFKKIDDKKVYIGILKEVNGDKITIETDDIEKKQITIEIKEIGAGNTVYDFN